MEGNFTSHGHREWLFGLGAFLTGFFVARWYYSPSRLIQKAIPNQGIKTLQNNELRNDIPENAPEECPGVESDAAGKSKACDGCPNQPICTSGVAKMNDPVASQVKNRLSDVKNIVLVLSGKGGVGKSTVATHLSWRLQELNFKVGLLDVDICGPSIPRMTNTIKESIHQSKMGWSPVYVRDNLSVISVGYLLPDLDDAIIWRGPKKNGLIRQFLTDVSWDELDILIIDTPPGTSDEHLSLVTYLKESHLAGAVIVTTPQEIAIQDVRKEINFCKKVALPVLGVIENMSESYLVTDESRVGDMSLNMGVPYIGCIPLDCPLTAACETGVSLTTMDPHSSSRIAINGITENLLKALKMRI